MARHDNYREGAWAIWPKDRPNHGGACWDSVDEAMAYWRANYMKGQTRRLVRLHRVDMTDVVQGIWHPPGLGCDIEKQMAKLGVALTERWVAAEEREIEPAAKEPLRPEDIFAVAGALSEIAKRDPLLSRLLAAWEKLRHADRPGVVENVEYTAMTAMGREG